jgi:hypothetical protein
MVVSHISLDVWTIASQLELGLSLKKQQVGNIDK